MEGRGYTIRKGRNGKVMRPLGGVGLGAVVAAAGDFDGSKQLICAPIEAMECHRSV
jgi:hypothetical protein